MLEQLLAIVRNTFFESIRQPVVLVVLVVATLLLILANPLSAFTMDDDQSMMVDMGLASVFVTGALLAGFVATGVLTREIENKTVLTVISKPVARPLFVIGKFLGVASALLICTVYLAGVFLLVERHSVLQTVRDPLNLPVIVFGTLSIVVGLIAATWANYFYGRVFSSSIICVTTPLVVIAYVLSLMFRHDFTPQGFGADVDPNLWKALFGLLVAILVMTAIAIAASARLGQVMTLVVTMGVFMAGLLSDWLVGRPKNAIETRWLERAQREGLTHEETMFQSFLMTTGEVQVSPIETTVQVPDVPLSQMAEGSEAIGHFALTVIYSILPNFQVFLLTDAVNQQHVIPANYVAMSSIYGCAYIAVALGLAVILFQRREVG